MKALWFTLLLTLSSANIIFRDDTIRSSTYDYEEETNTTDKPLNYDFIVKMAYTLEETRVPQFLVDVIFDRAETHNITTNDIIGLYALNKLSVQKTLNILASFDTPAEQFFSLDSLEHLLAELDLPFRTFYNTLKTDLALGGMTLRDALVSLGIDSGKFSDGLAYGEPDPYIEFQKGNFTVETLENACQIVGITLEDLYGAIRDIVLKELSELEVNEFLGHLKQHEICKEKALELWNTLNITLQHVYDVYVFRELLSEIDINLKKELTLGIITDENNITINRKTYNLWRNKVKLISIYAETLTTSTILKINEVVDTEYRNIVLLKFDTFTPEDDTDISHIHIGITDNDIENCQYITLQNEGVDSKLIKKVTHHQNFLEIPKGEVEELILGSPLICGNKVYGMAREIRLDSIILDAYSSASYMRLNGATLGLIILLYMMYA